LKAAMEMAGYGGGSVRVPLQPASEEARAEIEQLLRDAAVPKKAVGRFGSAD
jgi:dihydrodipicolinate synthase/N-acetylneuraminate lyase